MRRRTERGGRRTPGPSRPRGAGRRARRGTLEQPINSRLVRRAGLLLIAPLVLLTLTIGRPGPFPASALPPSFDGPSATALARELALDYPDREPGSAGATGAAAWVKEKLGLYGLRAAEDAWDETIPGLGRVRLRNLVIVVPGATTDAILVLSHRDNSGTGPGASDNASGTAALIELARGYGRLGTVAGRPQPQHTLVFLSSDGGAYGGYGAERFAATSPLRDRVKAAVSLDALAGTAQPRLEIAGFTPRSPAPALLRTADVQVASELGRSPAHPGWLVQLVDLGVPFGYGEQAPFLGRKISALRLTTAGDNPRMPAPTRRRCSIRRASCGSDARVSRSSPRSTGESARRGNRGYVYLGNRIIRGWALELVLLVALVPFLVGAIDLFARTPAAAPPTTGCLACPADRFGVWLWIGLLIGLGAVAGVFPRGSAIPPPPDSPAVTDWPIVGLVVIGALAALGWWRARRDLLPAPPASDDEVLAGYAVALLALGAVGIATAMISPYGLVFVVPSLYAWLWLPQVEQRVGWARDLLYGAGLAGPRSPPSRSAPSSGSGSTLRSTSYP